MPGAAAPDVYVERGRHLEAGQARGERSGAAHPDRRARGRERGCGEGRGERRWEVIAGARARNGGRRRVSRGRRRGRALGERVAVDRVTWLGRVFRTERGGARADRRRPRWRKTHLRRRTRAPRRSCEFRTARTSRDVPRSAHEVAPRGICDRHGNVSAFFLGRAFFECFLTFHVASASRVSRRRVRSRARLSLRRPASLCCPPPSAAPPQLGGGASRWNARAGERRRASRTANTTTDANARNASDARDARATAKIAARAFVVRRAAEARRRLFVRTKERERASIAYRPPVSVRRSTSRYGAVIPSLSEITRSRRSGERSDAARAVSSSVSGGSAAASRLKTSRADAASASPPACLSRARSETPRGATSRPRAGARPGASTRRWRRRRGEGAKKNASDASSRARARRPPCVVPRSETRSGRSGSRWVNPFCRDPPKRGAHRPRSTSWVRPRTAGCARRRRLRPVARLSFLGRTRGGLRGAHLGAPRRGGRVSAREQRRPRAGE